MQNIISSKLASYLESEKKSLDQAVLDEAASSAKNAYHRQLMSERESSKGRLRLSAGGHCVRKMYYQYTGETGRPMDGRAFVTFLQGDLVEASVVALMKLSGFKVYDAQKTVTVVGVDGHIDGIVDLDKPYLLEVKSMSDRSFDMFCELGLSGDFMIQYWTQASLYASALGMTEFVLIAVNKNNGKIEDRIFPVRQDLIDSATHRFEVVKNASTDPEREFCPVEETKYKRGKKQLDGTFESLRIPTGRTLLPIVCQYCQFSESHCWKIAPVIEGGKPVFVVSNATEPLEV